MYSAPPTNTCCMSRKCGVGALNVCGLIMCVECHDIQTLDRIWKTIFKLVLYQKMVNLPCTFER